MIKDNHALMLLAGLLLEFLYLRSTYPFISVCLRHTQKQPLINRLGLQAHLEIQHVCH